MTNSNQDSQRFSQESVRGLCEAIIKQAADDYYRLLRSGAESITDDRLVYSRDETTEFLKSEWGKLIAEEGIGMSKFNGKKFIELVEASARHCPA